MKPRLLRTLNRPRLHTEPDTDHLEPAGDTKAAPLAHPSREQEIPLAIIGQGPYARRIMPADPITDQYRPERDDRVMDRFWKDAKGA